MQIWCHAPRLCGPSADAEGSGWLCRIPVSHQKQVWQMQLNVACICQWRQAEDEVIAKVEQLKCRQVG